MNPIPVTTLAHPPVPLRRVCYEEGSAIAVLKEPGRRRSKGAGCRVELITREAIGVERPPIRLDPTWTKQRLIGGAERGSLFVHSSPKARTSAAAPEPSDFGSLVKSKDRSPQRRRGSWRVQGEDECPVLRQGSRRKVFPAPSVPTTFTGALVHRRAHLRFRGHGSIRVYIGERWQGCRCPFLSCDVLCHRRASPGDSNSRRDGGASRSRATKSAASSSRASR